MIADLLLWSLLTALAAGASADPSAPTWYDRVVVTAGRGEQRLAEVSAAVTVYDRQDVEASPALTADDLLRAHPGFSLFRRSGSLVAHPTTQGVSLRGVGPSGAGRTLVLLDGVPLGDPFGGWVYWSQVPKESLDRIEVVSGGGSDLWGSAALGGVIQLLTAPPEDELRLTAEAGERELASISAVYGLRWPRGAVGAEAATTSFAGHRLVAASQRGAIDVPAGLDTGRLYLRADGDLTDSANLQLRANLFREERDGGTPLTGNETEGGWVSLSAARFSSDREWRSWLTATEHRLEGRFSTQAPDRSSERPALEQKVQGTAVAAGAQLTAAGEDGGRTLAGIELRRLQGETREGFLWSDDGSGGRFLRRRAAGGEQWLFGLYTQRDWQPHPRLRLSASARGELWADRDGRRVEREFDGTTLLAEQHPDREQTLFSPRAGAVWAVRDGLLLRGAVYRSFRAPTVNELYRPFRVRNDITAANSALAAERLTGAELGIDQRGRRGGLRLTAFWNRIDDPVANVTVGSGPGAVEPCGFVPAGGVCRQRDNLGVIEVKGIEGGVEFEPEGGWRLSLSALVERSEVAEAPRQPELVGRKVAQVPDWQVVAGISRGSGPLGGAVQIRWVAAQFEDDLNEIRLDPYALVDVGLDFQCSERVRLFVKAENLLDESFSVAETADGIVSIGSPRLVRLGVRLRRSGAR